MSFKPPIKVNDPESFPPWHQPAGYPQELIDLRTRFEEYWAATPAMHLKVDAGLAWRIFKEGALNEMEG